MLPHQAGVVRLAACRRFSFLVQGRDEFCGDLPGLTELTDGTFPGQEAWRRYHETGEFPAELIPSLNQEGELAAGS